MSLMLSSVTQTLTDRQNLGTNITLNMNSRLDRNIVLLAEHITSPKMITLLLFFSNENVFPPADNAPESHEHGRR